MWIKTVVSLSIIVLVKLIDTTSPQVLFYGRVAFGIGTLLALLTCSLLYFAITKAEDNRTIWVVESQLSKWGSSWGSSSSSKEKQSQVMVMEYDRKQLGQLMSNSVVSAVMTLLLHLKFGFVPPLFFQAVFVPLNVIQSPLSQIHLLGRSDNLAPLLRPWKPVSISSSLLSVSEENINTKNSEHGVKKLSRRFDGDASQNNREKRKSRHSKRL